MKRRFIFSMLLVLSVLLLSSTGYSQQQVSDFGALKIRAVGDNVGLLFLFEGEGPHVVAFGSETPDITVIDPRGPGLGKIIVDKVHNAADGPVVTIINTGPHRAGSNAEFPDATTIIAHENTKAAMAKLEAFKGANAKFLPNKTFTDTLSMTVETVGAGEGTNRIDLHHFGPGHTNGDTVVVFPSLNTVYMSDLFPGRAVPPIDTANGGSALKFHDTLSKAIATLRTEYGFLGENASLAVADASRPGLKIVMPGRELAPPGPYVPTWLFPNVLDEYASFINELVIDVKDAFEKGKSVDEAVDGLTLPDQYKNHDMEHARTFIEAAYNELKR